MRFLFFILFLFTVPGSAFGQVVIEYTYSKSRVKPAKKTITFKELKDQYALSKKSVFRPPPPQ